MTSQTAVQTTRPLVPFRLAITITLGMAVAYTLLGTLQPPEPVQSLLAFVPGGISLITLAAAGLSRSELNLRWATISRPGLYALGITTLLLLPILASSTGWIGWGWLPALVYAPASGIAQELYFRASLLPGLERLLGRRSALALVVHSAIFVGFHFRTFRAVPTLLFAMIVALVLFLAGCAWGWQVQKDHTVAWAALQHSLFLVLMSMFEWA